MHGWPVDFEPGAAQKKKAPHPLRDGGEKEGLQSRELNTGLAGYKFPSFGAQIKIEL
jgi:hypothetical protein